MPKNKTNSGAYFGERPTILPFKKALAKTDSDDDRYG
jgi:hypothetical protein